ncbi:MAG: hypothetical protein JWN60_2697 [Acidobacteria bacterium]|nr:hypothetical protein [Acidobacteriota bacterium]
MISVVAFIAVIIAAYFVYKSAKDTNRNAVGWALLTFAVGVGLQIVFPAMILIVITVVMSISGKPLTNIDELPWSLGTIIGLTGVIVSFIGIWLILRRVSTIPDEEIFNVPPPPPSSEENM